MNKDTKGAGTPDNASSTTIVGVNRNKSLGEKTSEYFDGKRFVPKWLADRIMLDYTFKTMQDTDKIFVYIDGVYIDDGKSVVESVSQARLGSNSSNRRVAEVVGHIRRATRCHRTEFDRNPSIINLENGLFNIDEMELYPHTPDYLSLRKCPVVYDPDATCPTIMEFLEDVLQKNDVLFTVEMFGYAAMPAKRMNTAVFLEGVGRNGKSTLIDLLTAFVGEHLCAEITPIQMGNEDRFAIVDLHGKLVNKIDDLGDVTLKDLGRFKSVVAGKSVRGEHKFERPFSFVPHVLCVFACNAIPHTEDTTDGYYSRVRVISFLKQFVGSDDNLNLINELTTNSELSGMFNVSILAAKKAIAKNTFAGGKTIADKQREYLYASTPIARFIDEMCNVTDPDEYTPKNELYNQYIIWSRDNNLRVRNKGEMTQYLETIGVTTFRPTIDEYRVWAYSGIYI